MSLGLAVMFVYDVGRKIVICLMHVPLQFHIQGVGLCMHRTSELDPTECETYLHLQHVTQTYVA
jgi:hypothetical protein